MPRRKVAGLVPVSNSRLGRWQLGRGPRAPVVIPEGSSAAAVRQRDKYYKRGLACSDMVAAAVAVALALYLLGGAGPRASALLGLPLLVLVNKLVGLYDHDEHVIRRSTLDEAPQLFWVATLSAFLLWAGDSFWVERHLGRREAVLVWVFLLLFLPLSRTIVRYVLGRLVSIERCLVIGEKEQACRIARKLGSLSLNATVVGFVAPGSGGAGREGGFVQILGEAVDADPRAQSNGGNANTSNLRAADPTPPLLGSIEALGLVLVENEIQRVIFAPTSTDSEEILDIIRVVRALGVKVSILPRLFEVIGHSLVVDDVEGLPLLALRPRTLPRSSDLLKRALDVGASVVILTLGAPVFLVIALAIKLDSEGSVFFAQRRVGRFGHPFALLKFRTMVADAEQQKPALLSLNEADGLFKIVDDPRMTRVGRFLRRTNLDELPQVVNVLRGDMSLVGPRPLVPDEDANVRGWYRHRLHLKPGITGHWQVLGSARIPLAEMVKIDHLYAANWSLWLDLKILLHTIPYVIRQRGI